MKIYKAKQLLINLYCFISVHVPDWAETNKVLSFHINILIQSTT